ncbi:hypothetical protein KUCAC02_006641, partial [Chaenocephalus aceratus]
SLRGIKLSATLNKSLRYRADAGSNLSALGSSRILSLLLAGSKSNKQEDKWKARRKRGGGERTKRKNSLTPFANIFNQWSRLAECVPVALQTLAVPITLSMSGCACFTVSQGAFVSLNKNTLENEEGMLFYDAREPISVSQFDTPLFRTSVLIHAAGPFSAVAQPTPNRCRLVWPANCVLGLWASTMMSDGHGPKQGSSATGAEHPVLRTLFHERFESIEGISFNLPCWRIALLLPLTSGLVHKDGAAIFALAADSFIPARSSEWRHAEPPVCL